MSADPNKTTVPADLRYGPEHEWSSVRDGLLTMGITDYAQQQLGEIVFLDLPPVGRGVTRGEEIAEIESAKTVSAICAPCTGEVVEVNDLVMKDVERINDGPYEAWTLRIRMADVGEFDLLDDEQAYRERIEG